MQVFSLSFKMFMSHLFQSAHHIAFSTFSSLMALIQKCQFLPILESRLDLHFQGGGLRGSSMAIAIEFLAFIENFSLTAIIELV